MREASQVRTKPQHSSLLDNPRFYVLVFTVLLSLLVASVLRLMIEPDLIYYSRLNRWYAWIGVAYLYVALLMTPLRGLLGDSPRMKLGLYIRRAFGVSVAYFALLHIVIVLLKQIGTIGNIGLLPGSFQWSFFWGLLGFLISLMLALTSFDKAVAWLTLPDWKRLHRTVYIGTIFIMLHTWMIGQSVATPPFKAVLLIAAVLLLGLEAIRFSKWLVSRNKSLADYAQFIAILFVVIIMAILVLATQAIQNYSQLHEDHGDLDEATSLGGGHNH